MILVENIYLNQDVSCRQQDRAPPLFLNNSFPSASSNKKIWEADLKQIFVSI